MSITGHLALVEDLCRRLDDSGRLTAFDPFELSGHRDVSSDILSVMFSSPEVLRGGRDTARSDVFAIGLALYEAIAGRPAFVSDDPEILRHAILYAEPAPLAAVAPETPRALLNVVERALAKDPRRRYASLREFGREVARVRRVLTGAPLTGDEASIFEGSQGDTSGREWFAPAGLFVESVAPHRWLGAGMSLAGHSMVAAVVVAAVIVRPYVAPAQPREEPIFVTTAAPPEPPPPEPPPRQQAPSPRQPSKPVPPSANTTPMPAPEIAPPPAPVIGAPVIPTDSPLTTGVTTMIDVPPAPPTSTGSDVPLQVPLPPKIDDQPVNDADTDPVLIKQAQPQVPSGASGSVRVRVLVDNTGHVSRVLSVLDPTPYEDLIRAAALQCLFKPATKRLKRVSVEWTIRFELKTRR